MDVTAGDRCARIRGALVHSARFAVPPSRQADDVTGDDTLAALRGLALKAAGLPGSAGTA